MINNVKKMTIEKNFKKGLQNELDQLGEEIKKRNIKDKEILEAYDKIRKKLY